MEISVSRYEQPWRDINGEVLEPGMKVVVARSGRYGGGAFISTGQITNFTKNNVTLLLDSETEGYKFTTPYAPNKFLVLGWV